MRTLQIGDEWLEEREGGLARYFFELIRALPETGTFCKGLVVGSDRVTDSTNGEVVSFARAEAPLLSRWTALRRRALQAIRDDRSDLIAVHFAIYGLPIVDRLRSMPTVVHFHGPWAGESGVEGAVGLATRLKAAVERAVYSRARRFIVLSHSFEQELVRRYGVPQERVHVVPGGIDLDRFNMNLSRSEARERLGWPADRPILLTVRRQVRRMGLENLIDAMKTIARRCPEALLLLGGSGPISGVLQSRIDTLGLAANVRILGRIADHELPLAYRAADLTVVPSQTLEGFGLITLESMASGTPVYVTPVGGLPEILQPFAPECIFPNSSAEAMASVLSEVICGRRPGPSDEACRAYAADHFSWRRIAQQVRAVYDEAAA